MIGLIIIDIEYTFKKIIYIYIHIKMPITDAQRRAIRKYRQGNGLEIARKCCRKQNELKAEFTILRHIKVEQLFT